LLLKGEKERGSLAEIFLGKHRGRQHLLERSRKKGKDGKRKKRENNNNEEDEKKKRKKKGVVLLALQWVWETFFG